MGADSYRLPFQRGGALLGLVLAPLAAASAAPIITPGIELDETYTDNASLSTSGGAAPVGATGHGSADWISSISPSLKVDDQGARVQFDFIYDPRADFYARSGAEPIFQRLTEAGTAEIIPETLFLNTSTSINQQFLSNTAPVASTTLTTNSNLATVTSFSASPSLRHHFGEFADTQTLYTFSDVSTSSGAVASLRSNSLEQDVTSGSDFGRLGWKVVASETRDDQASVSGSSTIGPPIGSTEFKSDRLNDDNKYALFQTLSVLGGVGYERYTDPTLLTAPHGLTWNGGFEYQPAPTTDIRATIGRRYQMTDYEFSAHHDIGSETQLTSSYTETVQTTQSQLASQLGQLKFQNGVPVNGQTGLPFSNLGNPLLGIQGSPFGFTNSAFVNKSFQTSLVLQRGRNTYNAYVTYQKQRTELPPSLETIYGGGATWNRQLNPLLTGILGATYLHTNVGGTAAQIDRLYSLSATLSYSLSATASAQLVAMRSSQMFTPSTNSVTVDQITLSLQKSF